MNYEFIGLSDDGHGTVSTTADTNGAVLCTARSDPTARPTLPPWANQPCNTGSTKTDFFYRGGRLDKASQTYQFGSGNYDPKQAAFHTPDSSRAGDTGANLGRYRRAHNEHLRLRQR